MLISRPSTGDFSKSIPGIALCLALALGAVFLAEVPWVKSTLHFGPLLLVILFGIVLASVVKLPKALTPGIAVAQRPLLRWAVAGLGFKLSLMELLKSGAPALVVVAIATGAALAFGWWLGKKVGLNEKLSILLSVGGAVCGASAVVAADSVVQAEGEDAAVSLGVVTLWGTVGIFLFPLMAHLMAMKGFVFGVWTGASLQEMAQVVAGAQAYSDVAVKVATVVKLARICLLAPIVFFLLWWLRSRAKDVGQAKVSAVPWFLVMFVVFAALNTLGSRVGLTGKVLTDINNWVTLLLAVGMAGVGLKTSVRDLAKAGWRPILVGLGQWCFLSLLSIALIFAFQVR